MNRYDKIFITGHRGLVGSALVRELQAQGYENLYTVSRVNVDLTDPVQTKWYFSCIAPEYVFHCAARVGGIKDNIENPLSMFLDNLNIQNNVITNAANYGAKKLLFLGSSCIYPADCPRPLKEEYLLTGPFEEAVEPYGLAKMMGVKLCQIYRQERGCNFISALPCNLFGINDRIDEESSHIVPGLLLRMRKARREKGPFKVWGREDARRELLFADDLAKALIFLMKEYNDIEPINTGSGREFSVKEIAEQCASVVDYRGPLVFDSAAPVGTLHKCLDNSKLFSLGWEPSTPHMEALALTYADMSQQLKKKSNAVWQKNNPERVKKAKQKYRETHKSETKEAWRKHYYATREEQLAYHRKRKYGITDAQFLDLIALQRGECAICNRKMNPPQVDHCHATKIIRGLLCGPCNRALGLMQDSSDQLMRAAEYLKKFQKSS